MVKNLPANAGGMTWIPGQGIKIAYAAEQLNPHALITEPAHGACASREKPLVRSPHTATRE